MNEFLQIKKQMAGLQDRLEELGGEIIPYMKSRGIKTFTTPSGVISLVEETTAMQFSTTRFGFKEKYPQIYEENLQPVTKKEHLVAKVTK